MQCMSCILRKNIYVQLKLNVCNKIVLTNKMIEMMSVFEHELFIQFMLMALLKNKINLVFVGLIKIVFVLLKGK